MNFKLLFLFIFFTALSFSQTNVAANGSIENWTDTNTLDSWTIENNVTQNTTDTYEGTSSASFVITDNDFRPLILAKVPLTSGVTYTMSYKYKYIDSNYGGSHPISLKIIRDGSGTSRSSNTFASSNDWTEKSIQFTPDQSEEYDISLSIATFDGEGFEVLIDDIQVYDPASLSIINLSLKDDFNIYPTITEDFVFLENTSKPYEISVFDFSGKKQDIKYENKSLDFSPLKPGVYLINFKDEAHNLITKKIIKK